MRPSQVTVTSATFGRRCVALALASTLPNVAGCSGDHDLLAQKPDDDVPRDAASDTGAKGPRDARPPVDNTKPDAGDPETRGPWSLTWLNGVTDQGAVRFCLVPVVGGSEIPGDYFPVPASGLPFGESLVLAESRGSTRAPPRSTPIWCSMRPLESRHRPKGGFSKGERQGEAAPRSSAERQPRGRGTLARMPR